jgi:hypothetical protein
MCLWLWRDKIPLSGGLAFGCVVGLLIASRFSPWFAILFPIFCGYCIIWFGYGPKLKFLDWTNQTDLSYGTYLYAFPVQQIVAMHESLRHPWINFLISGPVAILLAWFSWHLVEKRFLAIKKSGFAQNDYDPGTGREVSAKR